MLSTCALHLARASSSALPCAPVLGAVAARYVLQRPAWATRMASGLASGLSGLSIMRRNVAALAAEQQADHSDNDDPQLQQQQPPLQQQQQVLLESGGGCAGCDALTAPLPSALLAAVGSRPHHHHHASEDEVTPIPAVSGRIHSVESFSAVDGPGVRMVVFEQVRLRVRACVSLEVADLAQGGCRGQSCRTAHTYTHTHNVGYTLLPCARSAAA